MSDLPNKSECTSEELLTRSLLVMTLLNDWHIPLKEQILVLGLPEKTPTRYLKKFGKEIPLPDELHINECIEHIVGIADALRTTYPHNAEMGSHWMRASNRHLNKKSPVAVLIEDGLDGIINVRSVIDCSFDWYHNGQ
jgi:hypothetical protein